MKNTLTIKEIAKLAGVSVTTVSRVINNQPNVTPAKRKKVKEIIEEYDFQPSSIARGMVSNKTNMIGIVVPDLSNPYFISLINQIDLSARNIGYSIIIVNTLTAGINKSANATTEEIDSFNQLEKRHVDGILILGGESDQNNINPEYINKINNLANRLPLVIIGQEDPNLHAVFIQRKQVLSSKLATNHLISQGFKNIGFIGGQPGIKITNQRLLGYKEAISQTLKSSNPIIINNDFYIQDGYSAINYLIKNKKLPEALVTINDMVAEGAIRALKDHNLSVPEDICIASCDAFPQTNYFIPRITTVDHHNNDLANIAMKYLINLINKKNISPISTPDPALIIRESSISKKV